MSKTSSEPVDLGTAPPKAQAEEDGSDSDEENGNTNTKIGIQGAEIPLQSLNYDQLSQLRQQLGVEINALKTNLSQLQHAGDRFRSSAECLSLFGKTAAEGDVGANKLGSAMLVPLSQSVFIDGYVAASDRVLVDVGTGYYLEKPLEKAGTFMSAKVENIQKSAAQLGQMLKKKEQVLEEATNKLMAKQKELGIEAQ